MEICSQITELLVCPHTHQALSIITPEELNSINLQLASSDRHAFLTDSKIIAGLITLDKKIIYKIEGGVIFLRPEDAIFL